MLSKKYKHGDYIVIPSIFDKMKVEFAQIVELPYLLLNRDKESFRHCVFGLQNYSRITAIVIFRTNRGTITWTEENKVRPATKAERLLYGETK